MKTKRCILWKSKSDCNFNSACDFFWPEDTPEVMELPPGPSHMKIRRIMERAHFAGYVGERDTGVKVVFEGQRLHPGGFLGLCSYSVGGAWGADRETLGYFITFENLAADRKWYRHYRFHVRNDERSIPWETMEGGQTILDSEYDYGKKIWRIFPPGGDNSFSTEEM